MACTPAPACRAALSEAMRRWPYRNVASDGVCASPRHSRQNPTSDHEPNAAGYATAFDLTDDKANGCDADALVEQLRQRQDPRVKYAIAERRMFSSYPTSKYPAWTWRPYTGSNPHTSHVHVSILPEAIHDTRPWFTEGDDMTDEEHAWLARIHHEIVAGDTKPDTVAQTLERIEALLAKIARKVGA